MTEGLSSWRDGPAKQAIIDFVAHTCGDGGSTAVPPDERIAVFDNDGTLWCEKPLPIQLDFILRRLAEMVTAQPELVAEQPWKAVSERDRNWFGALMDEHYASDDTNVRLLARGILVAFAGISVEDFEDSADHFLRSTQHPSLGRSYLQCTYTPMVELLDYLTANGFATYIASGGGRDFMRPVTHELYGIPRERVIGSSSTFAYTSNDHGGTIAHRIASYLGIAWGQIPPEHYFRMWRTFPDTCDWSWPEQKPVGEWVTHLGVPVFEGAYRYRGMQLVPTWGGSMFEALMVDLFVPEAEWGPRSWGVNHPLTVRAHIEHGMDEAGYGYWGFSPVERPGRRLPRVRRRPDRHGAQRLHVRPAAHHGRPRLGRPRLRAASAERAGRVRGRRGDAARVLPRPALRPGRGAGQPRQPALQLRRVRRGRLYDAVAVGTGTVARRYLSLDQGMVMAALGNELRDDAVRRYTVRGDVQEAIRPLLGIEEFNARG